MKRFLVSYTRTMLAGILLCMSVSIVAKEKEDSLILDKIFKYRDDNISEFQSLEDNIYTKYRFNVEERNFGLWLIPTTYVLAKDPREYIREAYSKLTFNDVHNFDIPQLRHQKSSAQRHHPQEPQSHADTHRLHDSEHL